MTAVIKFEQVILDNDVAAEVPFAITGPAKIAGTGTFELLAWNGVSYVTMGDITEPSYIASAGKYAVTAAGATTITVTPKGR